MAKTRIVELAQQAHDTGDFMDLAKAYNTACLDLIETVMAKHVAAMFAVLSERAQECHPSAKASLDTERAMALDAARRLYSRLSDQDAYVNGWIARAQADTGMAGNGEVPHGGG